MALLKDFVRRIKYLFKGSRLDDEMTDEIQHHIEFQQKKNLEAGMSEKEARLEAVRRFGNVERIKEECRDSWGVRLVSDLMNDLKLSIRRLIRNPGFTSVAIVSLGIAIGSNTAVFSMLNSILFRPLSVSNPEQLREINVEGPALRNIRSYGISNVLPDGRKETNAVPHSIFLEMQRTAVNHADVVGFSPIDGIEVRAHGDLYTGSGLMVSGNFFDGLGVHAVLGRTIQLEDDRPGAEPVAAVSYKYWQTRFNGDPAALNEIVTLNRSSFRIVGVLPQGFRGPRHGEEDDLYVPLASLPVIKQETSSERLWWIWIMARLKNESSNEQLKASLDLALERSISPASFRTDEGGQNSRLRMRDRKSMPKDGRVLLRDQTDQYTAYMRSILLDGSGGARNQSATMAVPFLLMLGAAMIVLFAACSNLAGLLIARTVSQENDLATRAALGASSLRLVRQGMTESLLIAILGAMLGWLLSVIGKGLILKILASAGQGEGISGENDHRVFIFTILITVLAAVLFGLFPSLQSFRINLMDVLRARTTAMRGWVAGRVFVALQVGLALFLITGAGLLLRSVSNIQRIDPGFDMENLLVFQLNARNGGYEDERKLDLYQRSVAAVRQVPGVKLVASSDMPLLANSSRTYGVIQAPDNPEFMGENVLAMSVSEDFFGALGIPILSGRAFQSTDMSMSELVVVVNESFGRKFFGHANPIGKRLTQKGTDRVFRIVGVCADTKYNRIKADARPILFVPMAQASRVGFGIFQAWIYVNTDLDPLSLVPSIRKSMATVDPDLPLIGVKTQLVQMNETIFKDKFQAKLLVVFASLGVFLSCIGTYGLMSYTVSRRTSEIGIRKALGAGSTEAIRPILKSSLIVTCIGLVLGIVFVLPFGNMIRDQLYRVEPHDPMIVAVAMVLLFIVSIGASWFPSRRAAKISPMETLRES